MTIVRPPHLPDYEEPPVVEVTLAVLFPAIGPLATALIGAYWQSKLRDRFPIFEQQLPLASATEEPDPWKGRAPLRIEIAGAAPSVRGLCFTEDRSQLIQLQADLFVLNWLKRVDPYPHYETIRETFKTEVQAFIRFLADQGVNVQQFLQCEVTYTNHIIHSHQKLDSVMQNWHNVQAPGLGDVEDAEIHERRRLVDEAGQFVGRLHIAVAPAFASSTMEQLTVLTLTVRGRPIGDGIEGVLRLLDLGREHIVEGFDSITTESMHSIWRKK